MPVPQTTLRVPSHFLSIRQADEESTVIVDLLPRAELQIHEDIDGGLFQVPWVA
jgi:hypothetical protein